MYEQSKAAKRRFFDGNFHNRYFIGDGIDIGGKPDPFSQYIGVFPLVNSVKIWDLEDGDAQYMNKCDNEVYDFLVSSHCLEHMVDVYEAFKNWLRIVKNGGYLIITVPDEDMYEQGIWPSKYNEDHKWTFTINKLDSWSARSINIIDLLNFFNNDIEIEKIQKISDFYNSNLNQIDQTMNPNIESCIEIIIKKSVKDKPYNVFENLNINKRFWLEKSTQVTQIDTLEFSSKYSKLFTYVNSLKGNNQKYVIYGYGSLGKTIGVLLGTQIICYIDQNSDKINHVDVKPLDYIKYIDFDKIIISTLGRESDVYNYLTLAMAIAKEKILNLDFDICSNENTSNKDIENESTLYGQVIPCANYKPWNQDKEFNVIYSQIQKNTLVDKLRCYELWTLVAQSCKLSDGDILEVGVWRGGTGALIAKQLSMNSYENKVFLCDTFQGVVKATEYDTFYKGGEHNDTDMQYVKELLNSLELKNVEILTGIFPDDTGRYLENKSFRFCHIDVDVYLSAKHIIDWIWEKLLPGGIIVYDDYGFESCPGITKHVEEQILLEDRIILHNLNGHAIIIKR